MRRLIVTSAAKQDLSDIVDYIARSSRDVGLARNFGRDLLGYRTKLATLPGGLR